MSINSSKKFFRVALVLVSFLVSCPSILAETKSVKASSFGFNPQNSTECLQKAINSGAKTIIVDNVGKDWIIDPIVLASNQEIIFSKNVTVRARQGGFKGVKDALFSSYGGKNIVLRGEGSVLLTMNKADYQNKALYKHSEWRHTINLLSCENVTIKNLTLSSSGGDGIYLGVLWGKKKKPLTYCKNILIENVKAVNHHRQGISIISAENLMIRNCAFNNTSGTAPQSGIDIEPNNSSQRFVNCVIENCLFKGNKGAGITVNLYKFNKKSQSTSIVFKDCKTYNNKSQNIFLRTEDARGYIKFINSSAKGKIMIFNLKQGFSVMFLKCVVNNISSYSAFVIASLYDNMGKVNFQTVDVLDSNEYAPIDIKSKNGHLIKEPNITGTLKYNNHPYNLEAFKDKYTKKVFKLESLENAKVNIEKLKGKIATASNKPGRFNIRNNACFLQYCQKGKEAEIILMPHVIGRPGKKKIDVSIFDPNNQMIRSIQLDPRAKPFYLKFVPKMSGIYKIKFKPNRQLLGIKSKSPGQCGFLIYDKLQMVRPLGNLYFEVPRGVTQFNLVLSGDPGEYLTASLLNPNGKVVQRNKRFNEPTIFTGYSSNNKQSEIWSIRIEESKEDAFVTLCKPLIPIVATDPALLLRVK